MDTVRVALIGHKENIIAAMASRSVSVATSAKNPSIPNQTTAKSAKAKMTLEKQFKKDFKDGVEFWTSQDGTLLSIAICFTPDWVKILRERVLGRNPNKRFKPSRVKVKYAYREWAEREYWYDKSDKGKVWRLGTDKTPFQVYEYELEQPV